MSLILPPKLDEETVLLDSIGPALAAMLRNQQQILIGVVMTIARISGQSPQQVLTEALTQCDITEEIWAAEPKVERAKPEALIIPV